MDLYTTLDGGGATPLDRVFGVMAKLSQWPVSNIIQNTVQKIEIQIPLCKTLAQALLRPAAMNGCHFVKGGGVGCVSGRVDRVWWRVHFNGFATNIDETCNRGVTVTSHNVLRQRRKYG